MIEVVCMMVVVLESLLLLVIPEDLPEEVTFELKPILW